LVVTTRFDPPQPLIESGGEILFEESALVRRSFSNVELTENVTEIA